MRLVLAGDQNMRLLQDMLSNLMRGTMNLSAFGRKHVSDLSSEPQQAVKAVLSATGEVSSLVYAENLLNVIEALDDAEMAAFLNGFSNIVCISGIGVREFYRKRGYVITTEHGYLKKEMRRLAPFVWIIKLFWCFCEIISSIVFSMKS